MRGQRFLKKEMQPYNVRLHLFFMPESVPCAAQNRSVQEWRIPTA